MSGRKRPRVAVLFAQFSAYHVDRCEAVAKRLAGRFVVLAVEVAATSRTYAWNPSGEVSGACKQTLFPSEAYEDIAWPRRLWRQFAALWRCRAVFVGIGYNEADVILLSWLLRLAGVQVFVMSESKFDDFQRSVAFEAFKSLVLAAYSGAIVGGQRQASYLRFLGFRRRPVLPGYDTVGVARIRAMAGGVAAPGGAPFAERPFVFVGRFVAKKNLRVLIEAFARYCGEAGTQARRLVLVGSGPEEQQLRARAAELGIDDRIDFAGFLGADEVPRVLARSLALLLPSREEQWGLVVNEAAALGVPAIVSNEVGARDALVRNLVNGFVVEASTPDGLAAAMLELGRDEAQWRRMVSASHRRAPLGDVERLADAAEVLLDPTASEAAAKVEAFRQALPPMPFASGHLAKVSEADIAAPDPGYWQLYYATSTAPELPSDFAVFALTHLDPYPTVIELGCGNGRDSLLFLARGKHIRAIDASSAAIAICNDRSSAAGHGIDRASFWVGEAGNPADWQTLAADLPGPVAIYARFLFHAIDEATETALLDQACALLARLGGILLAEFRTPADASLAKEAPAHYRRYVDPDQFCARLGERGLAVIDRCEGQGMACHGSEDAFVARIVAGP